MSHPTPLEQAWIDALERAIEFTVSISLDRELFSWRWVAGELRLTRGDQILLSFSDLEGEPESVEDQLPDRDSLREILIQARVDLIEEQLRPALERRLLDLLGEESWSLEIRADGNFPGHPTRIEDGCLQGVPRFHLVLSIEDLTLAMPLQSEGPPWLDEEDLERLFSRLAEPGSRLPR